MGYILPKQTSLPPHRTHRTKNSRLATHTNNQKPTVTIYTEQRTISTHSQRKRRTVNNNPRTSATQPSPNWTCDAAPLYNPPSTIFSVFNRIHHFLQCISATPMPHAPQLNPPHWTSTPAEYTGTTNTCSTDHRQQSNTTFLQYHYHIQLGNFRALI
jgi:hypothetical protein